VRSYRIAVIPGDGVGPEVIPHAIAALVSAAAIDRELKFEFQDFPWGCSYFLDHGTMMPTDGLATLGEFDHILLGAVGWPTVPDHVSLWGLLLPIRRTFQQYVNLRPARLLRGARSPLASKAAGAFDFTILRENTEGEYSDTGGRVHANEAYEVVIQTTVFTRTGTERIIRYGFGAAARSHGRLIGATKSNGLKHVMPYWDETFRRIGAEFPHVESRLMHADALAAKLVLEPESFDVIVASNLLGDILSEVAAAIQGSIGMAASANIDPTGQAPSMFEPVHGSAPDIAGQGIANPIGAVWAAKLLLDQVGQPDLGGLLLDSIEDVVAAGAVTPDLGGDTSTNEVGQEIVRRIKARAALEIGKYGTRPGD
jgi:tartrate dehydrogenase/decarboxylase/D-malate dehydrogenase